MPTYETKDGKIRIKGVPLEVLQNDTARKALGENVRRAVGEGEYNFLDVQGVAQAEAQRVTEATPGTLAPTQEQKEEILFQPPDPEAPKTTVSGIGGGILRELGPLAASAAVGGGIGLAAGGLGAVPGAALGMAAYGITEVASPFIAKFLNDKFGTKEVGAREGWSAIFNEMGVDDPDTAAEKVIQSGARGVKEAIETLATGAVLQFGKPILGVGNFIQRAGQILSQAAKAEVIGGLTSEAGSQIGTQIAEEQEMGKFGQMAMPIAGSIIGGGIGALVDVGTSLAGRFMKSKTTPIPDIAAEKIALSESRGVTPMTSDILNPEDRSWWTMMRQKLGENLPFGTGEQRRKQYTQLRKAINEEAVDFNIDVDDITNLPDYNTKILDDFLEVRGQKFATAIDAKKEIIEQFNTGIVDTSATVKIIDQARADLGDISAREYREIINDLTDWEQIIQGKDLVLIEKQRKMIYNKLKPSQAMPSGPDQEVQNVVNKIYDSLKDDMGGFIEGQGGPEALGQWKKANRDLATLADEFKDVQLEDIIEQVGAGRLNPDMVTPEVISNMLNSSKKSEVERLYNRLSVDGQATARTAVMHNIFLESMGKGSFEKMAPKEFAFNYAQKAAQKGILLDANQRQGLEGLKKVINMTGRSDMVFGSVSTGTAITGSIWKNLATVFSSGDIMLSLGGMAKLYEKPAFRDLMIKMAEIPTKKLDVEGVEIYKRIFEMTKAAAHAEQQRSEPELQGSVYQYRGDQVPPIQAPDRVGNLRSRGDITQEQQQNRR